MSDPVKGVKMRAYPEGHPQALRRYGKVPLHAVRDKDGNVTSRRHGKVYPGQEFTYFARGKKPSWAEVVDEKAEAKTKPKEPGKPGPKSPAGGGKEG